MATDDESAQESQEVYENSLVKPNDLSKLQLAFFNVNSYIAVVLLVFTTLDVVL